jgi:SAM-dependent methyltransferase
VDSAEAKKLVGDGYDRLCDTYAAWTSAGHGDLRRRYIDRVFELGLTPRAQVLDLGCGTGRHATAYLVERGLEVTGVDLSPKSVQVAKREVPGARFLLGDMSSIHLPPSSFDLVTAFYSLIHVPKEEHATVMARIWSWLRPGGHVVVTMGGGDHPGEEVEGAWLGLAPMFWSNWDVATSRRLVREAGFEEVDADLESVDEDGRQVLFFWVVGCKPAESAGRGRRAFMDTAVPITRGPAAPHVSHTAHMSHTG